METALTRKSTLKSSTAGELMPDDFTASAPATVGDAIEEIGFGPYQLQVFLLSAGFIVAEGSELQTAAGLSNAVSNEFGIDSHVGRSLLMTLTFSGFAVGTVCSGPLGDAYGRRLPMFVGYIGVVAIAFCTFFVQTADELYTLRMFLGFFGGLGIPTALITISESSPKSLRGMCIAAVGVSYSLGELWAACGLRLILPDLENGHWRLCLLWAALPATCLLAFGSVSRVSLYDTPFWLSTRGPDKADDLLAALAVIADMNSSIDRGISPKALKQPTCEQAGFRQVLPVLVRWPMFLHVIVLCLVFFAKDFMLYGMAVFWPLFWAQVEGFEGVQPASQLMATASLGIPGVAIAMCSMHFLPRRHCIAIFVAVTGIAALLIRRIDDGDKLGFLGIVVFKLCYPSFQMVTMILPSEIFPTQVRAWGFGIVALFGRFACIISPFVVEFSHVRFLATCAGLSIVVSVAAWLLPETKDCQLLNISATDMQHLSGKGMPKYGPMEDGKIA